jgi:16S rRNA (uracil1498-N3)-methyltransferase
VTAAHFFSAQVDGEVVTLTGDDARHASRVLRIHPGEEITVSNGVGTVVRARCTSATASRMTAEVMARTSIEQPRPRLVVYPAVPKAGKLETIVQKLTELGVDEIRPWMSSRSVVRWDASKARGHAKRLAQVAREAAKQSRRAWLPLIGEAGQLGEIRIPGVVLHEGAGRLLRDVLPAEAPEEFGVIIGPEGGLTDREVDACGVPAASLGDQILRTETAVVVGAALVLHHFHRIA